MNRKALSRLDQPARRPVRILLSYHYFRDEDLDELLHRCFGGLEGELDLFADSGAFSAWKGGAEVKLKDYAEWLNRWGHHFNLAAGLDVIGDAGQSARQFQELRDRLKPGRIKQLLPTFHIGSPWPELERLLQLDGIDYLAFGGMVPYTRNKPVLGAWLDKAWSMIPESMRVHGFGMTTWSLLTRHPWASVDSSSWTSGFRYAQISLFNPRGKLVTIDMRNRTELLRHGKLLASYGIRSRNATAGGYNRDQVCAAIIESWQRCEAWLEARAPTRLYLVTDRPSNANPEAIARGLKEQKRVFLALGRYNLVDTATIGRGIQAIDERHRPARKRDR